jgi:hypothetical protein
VGNAFFPIMQVNHRIRVFASDFSKNAIALVKGNPLYNEERVTAWVHDAAVDPIPSFVPANVDLVLIFFVLSAVATENFKTFVKHACSKLKSGGKGLIFLVDPLLVAPPYL